MVFSLASASIVKTPVAFNGPESCNLLRQWHGHYKVDNHMIGSDVDGFVNGH